jgi:hypothetical protein
VTRTALQYPSACNRISAHKKSRFYRLTAILRWTVGLISRGLSGTVVARIALHNL